MRPLRLPFGCVLFENIYQNLHGELIHFSIKVSQKERQRSGRMASGLKVQIIGMLEREFGGPFPLLLLLVYFEPPSALVWVHVEPLT